MRIGILAEGYSDIAVLENILYGELKIQRNKIDYIRPRLTLDETDLALAKEKGKPKNQAPEEFSNCALVFQDCKEQEKILDFLGGSGLTDQIDDDKIVVVHVDTAECHEIQFGIIRPDRKSQNYSILLCCAVRDKLSHGFSPDLFSRIRWAIAVEEIEAWLLTIWDPSYRNGKNRRDTGRFGKAKEEFKKLVGSVPKPKKHGAKKHQDERALRKKRRSETDSEYFRAVSLEFRDKDRLHFYASRNQSLKLFLESLASVEQRPTGP